MAVTVYAPVLAGSTLPHVSDFDFDYEKPSAEQEMANGTLVRDIIGASKYRFYLKWNRVSASEFDTIRTAYDTTMLADSTFTDINNVSYTVTIEKGNTKLTFARLHTAVEAAYSVEMRLREV